MSSTTLFPAAWIDTLGGVASTLCVAHCVLLGFLPAAVSLLGLGGMNHEALEWGFFTLAVSLAVVAAGVGWRRHRTVSVLCGFGLGVTLLVAGRLGEAFALHGFGELFAIAGGLVLVTSHLVSPRCALDCAEPS